MGWYYTHGASRSDVIDELTEDRVTDERVFRTLRKCFRGNTMYALHESGKPGETKKWIGVYLLQRGTSDFPGWGYKPMDETMGPYHCDCPVSYLDEADEPMGDTAKEWREACRERAAARASKKPKVGETWTLRGCRIDAVRIVSLRPLRGLHQGTRYKIKRSLLGERVVATLHGNSNAVITVSGA
jgi:hypothetical protein